MVVGKRLSAEHVQYRPREVPRVKALDQRIVIDQCPSSHIDEQAAGFHADQGVGIHEVLRLTRGRRCEDHHVCEPDHLVKLLRSDGSLCRVTRRRV